MAVLVDGASSLRVLGGSKTKGSTAIDVTPDMSTISGYRDGVYLRDYQDVYNDIRHQIRPNTSNVMTFAGKSINEDSYDDQLSPTYPLSSSLNTESVHYQMGTMGKFRHYLNHKIEQRDLGQTDLYADAAPFYEYENPDDPVAVISTHPLRLELPASLVDHSSVSALDGVLEPLETRSSIDRSTIDHPFNARGVKASYGVGTDAFLRSFTIEDGTPLPGNESGAEAFLDSVSTMGDTTQWMTGSIDIPGAFYEGITKTSAFKESTNDIERFYDDYGTSISSDIRFVIIDGFSWTVSSFQGADADVSRLYTFRANARRHDRHTSRGFDYDNGIGIDSIVYGGLKK